MANVIHVDLTSRSQINQFVMFPFELYKGVSQWVPPFISDVKTMMNPNKHPFFEHSKVDFFMALDDGKVVGRIAAIENKPYNQFHGSKQASFYFLEVVDDQSVADALFNRAFEWAHARGLNRIVGPKGLSGFDGYGIQIEGSEHRQMMTMMNYNLPYLPKLVEKIGFERENDFVSCYLHRDQFALPEKVKLIAQKVRERGAFKVVSFKNKAELKKWAWRIGQAYNQTFVNNWEYYPLTDREIQYVVDTILTVADPKLIKIITYKDEVVGFIFAFADISAALQRQKGRITPWGIVDILAEMRRTKWVSLNGVGVLPEYQGRGGNVLMYAEMEATIKDFGFEHAEQTQMADSAVRVRQDMVTIGAKIYKRHRVYGRDI